MFTFFLILLQPSINKNFYLKMNSDEFEGIINFIREGNYPPEAQASRQTKWNYKKRSAPYFIGESNRLFKVGLILYAKICLKSTTWRHCTVHFIIFLFLFRGLKSRIQKKIWKFHWCHSWTIFIESLMIKSVTLGLIPLFLQFSKDTHGQALAKMLENMRVIFIRYSLGNCVFDN